MSEENYSIKLIECLTQQLVELELLQSMFPEPGEVTLTDSEIVNQQQNFIEKQTQYAPGHLDFIVNFNVGHLKLELCVELPHLYPEDEPDVLVRCNTLNRKQQTLLNQDLSDNIRSIPRGETCIYTLISWLQNNAEEYLTKIEPNVEANVPAVKQDDPFVRYWIYSHHIYNKRKRDEISTNAKELNLTGFCLPGKPGIICIEGDESNCKEWWRVIKSMTWKKIIVRKTEIFKQSKRLQKQKFDNFEELHFQNPGNAKSKHMDMSRFHKYMEEHGLTDAFNDFFGLCNDE